MRKMEEKIVNAWNHAKPCKVGNTRTDGQSIWLHDNKIITWQSGIMYISLAGWCTVTTRSRINAALNKLYGPNSHNSINGFKQACLNIGIRQHKHCPYFYAERKTKELGEGEIINDMLIPDQWYNVDALIDGKGECMARCADDLKPLNDAIFPKKEKNEQVTWAGEGIELLINTEH